MKKAFFTFLLSLSFLCSSVSAENLMDGFNGFEWGTSFESVQEKVPLSFFFSHNNQIDIFIDPSATKYDEFNNIAAENAYHFQNSKLIAGEISFLNKKHYEHFLGDLSKEFGHQPKDIGNGQSSYVFQNTYIIIEKWNNTTNQARIIFMDIPTITALYEKEAQQN